ncbi:hypothetical protein GF354_05830 [Candidatus Peregrinibacteria bacterium]|nr:hypothetical protein [Candidatus Peregrinibacteria bacterium]
MKIEFTEKDMFEQYSAGLRDGIARYAYIDEETGDAVVGVEKKPLAGALNEVIEAENYYLYRVFNLSPKSE